MLATAKTRFYAISWEHAINMDMLSLSDSSSKENGRSKTPRVCAAAAAAALCALAVAAEQKATEGASQQTALVLLEN